MIAEPEHHEVAELLGAYALDAVDDDESRRVEHHLGACVGCRAEADHLREVAAALGARCGLETEQPPAAVWERIAADIGIEASDAGRRTGTRWHPSTGSTSPLGGVALTSVATSAQHRRPARRKIRSAALVAIAAAAVIALLAFGLVRSQGRVDQLQSALAGQGPGAAVRAALGVPGHQLVRLRSATGADVARLVVDPSGVGYVVSSTMSPLPSGQTYQLWASIDGRPISLGLLGSRLRRGGAFSLGSATSAVHELMVTVEPAGGVAIPDHLPIATARVRLG